MGSNPIPIIMDKNKLLKNLLFFERYSNKGRTMSDSIAAGYNTGSIANKPKPRGDNADQEFIRQIDGTKEINDQIIDLLRLNNVKTFIVSYVDPVNKTYKSCTVIESRETADIVGFSYGVSKNVLRNKVIDGFNREINNLDIQGQNKASDYNSNL